MEKGIQEQFLHNNAKFSSDLYSQVKENNAYENIIISPFSIQTSLALASVGAGGKTAEELATALHLISDDKEVVGESFRNVLDLYKDSPLLKIANKLYVKINYQVKDEFNISATKYFHSEVENIEFEKQNEAAAKMNFWVENITNHKIKDLVKCDTIDALTRMVLINVIYFKGEWEHQFEETATQMEDFWITKTKSVKVEMMNIKEYFRFGEFKDLNATALEMPYKNSNLSMLILLPKNKSGLSDLEEKLQRKTLTSIIENMFFDDVVVKFPKFKTEFEIDLKDTFEKMGMGLMFSRDADFSNVIDSPEPLYISKVIHKAFIEVNERGTEAVAATAMDCITWDCCRVESRKPKQFFVNRPFIYIIKDNEGHNLFYGRYVKIQNEEEHSSFSSDRLSCGEPKSERNFFSKYFNM